MTDLAAFFDNTSLHWSGCITWDGKKNAAGYGLIFKSDRTILAHRKAYELRFGPIPRDFLICHRCDRPSCVNPNHLFVGTYQDNSDDMWRKNRGKPATGEQNGKSILTAEQIISIKRLLKIGYTRRYIATRFGTSKGAIESINRGTTWKHVIIA